MLIDDPPVTSALDFQNAGNSHSTSDEELEVKNVPIKIYRNLRLTIRVGLPLIATELTFIAGQVSESVRLIQCITVARSFVG
ncbi:hypothetical protein TNCV_952821 [Trichonephila clavipes]|nr:hypothetical protein TNCV_952821 [Trichonephila clavipes]